MYLKIDASTRKEGTGCCCIVVGDDHLNVVKVGDGVRGVWWPPGITSVSTSVSK